MTDGRNACIIHETAYIAEGAILRGNITVGENASIWNNAVVRGDRGPVVIGKGSNIQDNATIHLDAPFPVRIGENVTVGHGAIVHGCEIGDNTLIGMGAIIMNGARIGKNCIVAAGALVTQGQEIPDGSMVMGMPGRVKRSVTEEEIEMIRRNGRLYAEEAGALLRDRIAGARGLQFDVPEYKKLRVIIDTDAACEADDPFAIVQALLSPKLIVKGIIAEHFKEPGSMERSYREIRTILDCMALDVPVFSGQEGPLEEVCRRDGREVGETLPYGIRKEIENTTGTGGKVMLKNEVSEGVRFLIDEALREDEKPLYVLCQGAITNVAMAMKVCPEIIKRMTVIWIGTHGAAPVKAPFREFNAGNDVAAANVVLSCGGDIWVVPSTVYSTIHIGIAEIQRRILPCGKIGEHLFWNLVNYNNSEVAGWTKGESWSLGDSPAIALALNPDCGHYRYVPAPFVTEDTSSAEKGGISSAEGECQGEERPVIRMYQDIDARYILEDLFAKLELFSGK